MKTKLKTITTIRDVQPQRRNGNKHTQRGLALLEDSLQRDGWIGAITVASDGETFDGSARTEVGAAAGFEDAIVVDSDGTKPVIVRRTDIATADDPKAKRLGVAANHIAHVDYDPDFEVLKELAGDGLLDGLMLPDELAALNNEAPLVDFKEYGEDVENDVQYCECPSCGHKFPK